MKKKLLNLFNSDPLLLHKVGFIGGAALGVLSGLIITERADYYEDMLEKFEEVEEVVNGEEN